MLTTIQGTYSNGVVILNEEPPTTKTSKVLITFGEIIEKNNDLSKKDVENIFKDCRISL